MSNKIFKILSAIAFSIVLQVNNLANAKPVKIYINQLVEHPALDSTTKGVIDGLAENGYENGKNAEIRVESAQGSVLLAGQISNKFVSNEADVIVGVATVSAQSVLKYAKNSQTKLIFTTVTDPLDAGLVQGLEQPGNNTSGVSNFVPLEPQLKMFKQVKPSLKKLGFLYNPGELNSISLIKKLEALCPDYGIELVTIAAGKTSEVSQAAIKLSDLVDAIFISSDNTSLSAFPIIVKAANSKNIPVFVGDTGLIESGAIAALGPDQYELGKQTANMVLRVLKGEDINKMKIEFPSNTELFLNNKAAEKLSIVFDDELVSRAKKIIQ